MGCPTLARKVQHTAALLVSSLVQRSYVHTVYLNLAVGSLIAIVDLLADLFLAIQYGIAMRYMRVRNFD